MRLRPPQSTRIRAAGLDCGASRATPSFAASSRSSIAACAVWAPTAVRAPTATWRPTTSSSRPASVEARFRLLQLRRRWDPDADDPLFRPIDADDFRINGENASDFTNLRQNGLIRVVLPLPPNVRLIDPATNQPSGETFADVWRAVPTVNDVKLTGPDGVNPWPRGPNQTGGYQMDARVHAAGAGARRAGQPRAEPERAAATAARRSGVVSARAVHERSRARSFPTRSTAGTTLPPDPDPPLNELEQQGKVVFKRACAHCHGGPGQSTTQPPILRFHDITTQCPRPVDTVTPARFAFAPALPAGAQCADLRDHAGRRHEIRRDELRSRSRIVDGIRRRPGADDDWNKFDVPGLRGIRNTAPYFHNNSAATLEDVSITTSSSSSGCGVAQSHAVSPVASTDGVHFDRQPTAEERAALLAYLRKL